MVRPVAEPDLSAELDAAEDVVMRGAEVVTEWGVRAPLGHVTKIGSSHEAERTARMLAADHEANGNPDALVRRTVTYGPWEVVPDVG
jgi:hypothetical protein